MIAIAVVDMNWAIGQKGRLLAHLPGDLKFFQDTTRGQIVVMGRKTLTSLPGGNPLPGRLNIVLSGDERFSAEGATVVHDEMELFSVLGHLHEKEEYRGKEVFVMGGEMIYNALLPHTNRCLITRMEASFAADTWFPDLDEHIDFRLTREGEPVTENGIVYRFCEYTRVSNLREITDLSNMPPTWRTVCYDECVVTKWSEAP
jgi:dihydrofolate reductase